MIMGNVIVGQSGGPSAVINASLAGVYARAKEKGATKTGRGNYLFLFLILEVL